MLSQKTYDNPEQLAWKLETDDLSLVIPIEPNEVGKTWDVESVLDRLHDYLLAVSRNPNRRETIDAQIQQTLGERLRNSLTLQELAFDLEFRWALENALTRQGEWPRPVEANADLTALRNQDSSLEDLIVNLFPGTNDLS